jgi:histidinol-phosphatase (PHP family)
MQHVSGPADSHVHTEWSWDAPHGSMQRSCERAVELGLPGIAFTEHLDHTVWTPVDVPPGDVLATLVGVDGTLTPPALDTAGYLAGVERCRELFPGLRIITGLEIGEPHRHRDAVAAVLAMGRFDRVLGSLHCLQLDDGFVEPPGLYQRLPATEVVRRYLVELTTLVAQSDNFAVLAHIDYPLRDWPATEPTLDLHAVEDELRQVLRVTADSGRALEVNTTMPVDGQILRWWREEGGQEITFGSDAHEPRNVARRFREAVAIAEAHGFRPGADLSGPWTRTG